MLEHNNTLLEYSNSTIATISNSSTLLLEQASVFSKFEVSLEVSAFFAIVTICLVSIIFLFFYLNKAFCFRRSIVNSDAFSGSDAALHGDYRSHASELHRAQKGTNFVMIDEADSESDAATLLEFHRQGAFQNKSATMQSVTNCGAASPMPMNLCYRETSNSPTSPDCEERTLLDDSILLSVSEDQQLRLDVEFSYRMGQMRVAVKNVENLHFEQPWCYQVHLTLLPAKKIKFETKYSKPHNDTTATFNEKFLVPLSDPKETFIRFRLYGKQQLFQLKNHLIGSCIVSVGHLQTGQIVSRFLTLALAEDEGLCAVDLVDPKDESICSALLKSKEPCLSIGISYNPVSNRLMVEVGQARGVRTLLESALVSGSQSLVQSGPSGSTSPNNTMANSGPLSPVSSYTTVESYVKVLLTAPGGQLEQAKTRVAKGQNPVFRETFAFNVTPGDLAKSTIGLLLYTTPRLLIGCIAIGPADLEYAPQSQASRHFTNLLTAMETRSSVATTRVHVFRSPYSQILNRSFLNEQRIETTASVCPNVSQNAAVSSSPVSAVE